MALRTGGDINSAYAGKKTVFKPGLGARTSADALDAAGAISRSLTEQLGRLSKTPPAATSFANLHVANLGCSELYAYYCASVHDAVKFALDHQKKVLVVTQPYINPSHRAQQRDMRAMLAAQFGGNPAVGYIDLGEPDFAAQPGARVRRDAPQRGRKPDGRRGAGAPDCPADAGRIRAAAGGSHVRAMTRSRWAALGDVYVAAPVAPSHRSFGLTVGSVLAAFAAFTLWRGHTLRAEVLGVLGGALIVAAPDPAGVSSRARRGVVAHRPRAGLVQLARAADADVSLRALAVRPREPPVRRRSARPAAPPRLVLDPVLAASSRSQTLRATVLTVQRKAHVEIPRRR